MDYIETFERVEHKYLLTINQTKQLYELIQEHIKEDIYPHYSLYNIYYDSDDYQMISKSIEGPRYKEKLRVRSYGDISNNGFIYVEMKKKYNGIVYKRRIQVDRKQFNTCFENQSQIGKEITYLKQFYQANQKVFISYDRYAFFARKEKDVRITFDTNIQYRLDELCLTKRESDQSILDKDKVLLEIKVMDRYPLWLIQALSQLKLQRTSFSKYGTIYTNIIKERNQYV